MYKLLMVEKEIRGGIYHAIHEIMIKKKKNHHILNIGKEIIYMVE